MSALLLLLAQTLDLGSSGVEDLPKISELEWEPPRRAEERISAEAFAVYTKFDSGLRIHDAWGFGTDVKLGVNWEGPATMVVRLGYAGWDTDNVASETFPGRTRVRQYRIGFGGDFATRLLDFGVSMNGGLYHFHTRHVENDTRSFFELEGSVGFKPTPFLKIGLVGMVTWTVSDFNRASSHLFTNESIGPVVEVKFEF